MGRRHKPKARDRPDDVVVRREPMFTFGERLKAQREQHGFSLAQIAEGTKIGQRYLEALEQNEFECLPGGVFNRGFVRAVAQFIGADAEKLVRDYAREESSRGLANPDNDLVALKATLERQAPTRGRLSSLRAPGLFRRVLTTGIVAGAVALAGWGYVRYRAAPRNEVGPLGPELAWNAGRAGGESETTSDASTAIASLGDRGDRPRSMEEGPETDPDENVPPPAPVAARTEQPAPARPAPGAAVPAAEPAWIAATPEIATETERDEPAEPVTNRMSISEFGVGERVVNHRLQGRADRFPEGSEVSFWTRVLGGEPGQRIVHVWSHEGRQVGSSELRIGGSHWRTHSRRTLRPGSAGQWRVEARDMEGRTLAVTSFVCDGPEAGATVDRSP